MSDITKLEVRSPEGLYSGTEEERLAISRDEGPEIIIKFRPEIFHKVAKAIRKWPIAGLNEENYMAGGNGEFEANTATLHDDGQSVLRIAVSNQSNSVIIHRQQVDPDKWASGDDYYGARGTRRFGERDVEIIADSLRHIGVILPDSFPDDLQDGIRKATPHPGHIKASYKKDRRGPLRQGDQVYEDLPGEDVTVRYTATSSQKLLQAS